MITQDFNQWVPFMAIVEDVADPMQVGRVRLRVINHHDETIATEQLDWATPIIANSASHSGVGLSPTSLEIGSMVVGFFLDGAMRAMPIILGSFAKIPGGDPNNHDVHPRARGINNIENSNVGPEPDPQFAAEYPYNQTFSTAGGHLVEYDDTPGAERITIRHRTGSYVEINNEGQVVIKAVDDQYIISGGDTTTYADGQAKFESKGKMTIKTDGKLDLIVDNECKVKSNRKITLQAPLVELQGIGLGLPSVGGVLGGLI